MFRARWNNPEKMELAYQAINELRALKRRRPYVPTADVEIVWVLSAPGTVKETSNDGIYEGENMNLKLIMAGVEMVRQITALRLGIDLSEVTKTDIADRGPVLYYNGEDEETQPFPGQMNTERQNEDLMDLIVEPGFPLPAASVVVDHISECGTPAQIKGMAKRLNSTAFDGKVAVLSMVHHSVRVGRYIEQNLALFDTEVTFVNAPLPETVNPVGKTLREVRKVATYGTKQPPDLAHHNYFFTRH